MRILVIEDENKIANSIKRGLEQVYLQFQRFGIQDEEKVFDLMARMQDTKEALEALPAEYVRFIEIRFSGRHAAKTTHPHRYENDVLAAYISALGYVVMR